MSTHPIKQGGKKLKEPPLLEISSDESSSTSNNDSQTSSSETTSSSDSETENDQEKGQNNASLLSLLGDNNRPCFDFTDWILAMTKKWPNAIPVFSVKMCLNSEKKLVVPTANKKRRSSEPTPGLLGYSTADFETQKQHGDLNLSNGTFTVKTPGAYLFHFSGWYLESDCKFYSASAQIRVNGCPVARSPDSSNSFGYEYDDADCIPVAVSSFLLLQAGDTVDSFSDMPLAQNQEPELYGTRFSAIYFSEE